MISDSDFLRLPYTPDLSESGIAYATRALAHGHDRGGSHFIRLRRIVSNVAVELAFRRFLGENGIPFEIKGALPFSNPNQYDVTLGRHRCNILTQLTSNRRVISALRSNPEELLQAPAMVPEDQLSNANPTCQDLYIFAFLLGITTNSPDDIRKALQARQPSYPIHPFRTGWSHPQIWAPLEKLSLKSECPGPIDVEIGGLDTERNFLTEKITLAPLKRIFATNNYNSLAFIHTPNMPEARLGLHSPNMGEPYLIQPHEWDNIWVYGLEIWMAGFMAQDEFRRKANTTLNSSRVFQYSQTQLKSLSIPVKDLHPLDKLFKQVKIWEIKRKTF